MLKYFAIKSGKFQLGKAGKNNFLCSSFIKLMLSLKMYFWLSRGLRIRIPHKNKPSFSRVLARKCDTANS